jgi:hypothetical protein
MGANPGLERFELETDQMIDEMPVENPRDAMLVGLMRATLDGLRRLPTTAEPSEGG